MLVKYAEFIPANPETFREKYRNFAPLLDRADLRLWDELNNEAAYSHMRSATECWEYPAVAGVTRLMAPLLVKVPEAELDYVKKGIGAMVCCIMESNGYCKTGIKRSVPPIPLRVFSRAEVYQKED